MVVYLTYFTIMWLSYTIVFAIVMCPTFSDIYKNWISNRAMWIHYHINVPISIILSSATILLLLVYIIL